MSRTLIVVTLLLASLPSLVTIDRNKYRGTQFNADMQIVLDSASLDFDKLLNLSKDDLYVVVAVPNEKNGTYIQKYKYGSLTYPDTKATVPIFQSITPVGWKIVGRYVLVSTLTQKPEHNAREYEWIVPDISYYRAPVIPKYYVPWSDHDNRFLNGGTIICSINTSVSGSGRFSNDVLIPSVWQQYVSSALRYHKEHPSFFSPDNAKKNNADLVKLANSSNPFLSIEATRSLAKDGLLGASFIQSDLATADFYKQAVDTLLVLRNATPQTRPGTIKDLSDLISTSANADSIKGIALAAFVANDDVLLAQLDKKETALNSNTPADKYIVNILQTAGTRKSATEIRQP